MALTTLLTMTSLSSILGYTAMDISASTLMWNFFAAHRLGSQSH